MRGFFLLGGVALSVAGISLPTVAHDWYTGLINERGLPCCGGDDCGMVPYARVRPTSTGYDVDIRPGTHPKVRASDWRQCYFGGAYCTEFIGVHTLEPVTFHFEGSPGLSPDGEVHACIDGSDLAAREIRCLFLGGLS